MSFAAKYKSIPMVLWMGMLHDEGIEVTRKQLEENKIDWADLEVLWHDPLYDHFGVRLKRNTQ
jgi:hypothetical protein